MKINHITFDAADARSLAEFWAAVLGWGVSPNSTAELASVGGPNRPPDTPALLFLAVPEQKTAKNRMHLDLTVDDLEAERARVESLGAAFVHEKDEYGTWWMTFRDPEGNEFCITQARAD